MHSRIVHVAVAAIPNDLGEYLLTRRPDHVHQGGLWEFPGGKVEADESVEVALARELREELGITPREWAPLIRIRHSYPDKQVLLDVFRVMQFSGEPHGCEGQPFAWVAPTNFGAYPLPEANRSIADALRLPDRLLVTPEPDGSIVNFMIRFDARLARGDLRLVQLRAKSLSESDYRDLACEAIACGRAHSVRIFLNADPRLACELGADGVHLGRERLLAMAGHDAGLPLSAAVHDMAAVEQANRLGVEFMLASPVAVTATHPHAAPLGWTGFATICEAAAAPVYALGGMRLDDIPMACAQGGQGIAAIRALW